MDLDCLPNKVLWAPRNETCAPKMRLASQEMTLSCFAAGEAVHDSDHEEDALWVSHAEHQLAWHMIDESDAAVAAGTRSSLLGT
jgi:O-acetyl-ADP-ribose deacetylase (regulator of RNase III)